ncbi:unnamed protein product, partial [Vitis vinifera]|uniref:Uncharacterized protein n=1 Tax=Vitis vinifera TaxID=29760 RepID=E0CPE4_VITVI
MDARSRLLERPLMIGNIYSWIFWIFERFIIKQVSLKTWYPPKVQSSINWHSPPSGLGGYNRNVSVKWLEDRPTYLYLVHSLIFPCQLEYFFFLAFF